MHKERQRRRRIKSGWLSLRISTNPMLDKERDDERQRRAFETLFETVTQHVRREELVASKSRQEYWVGKKETKKRKKERGGGGLSQNGSHFTPVSEDIDKCSSAKQL